MCCRRSSSVSSARCRFSAISDRRALHADMPCTTGISQFMFSVVRQCSLVCICVHECLSMPPSCLLTRRLSHRVCEIILPAMSATTPCTLSLPPDLIARIDEVAAQDDRSRSAVVRRILASALADHAAAHAEAARRFHELKGSTAGSPPPATLDGANGGGGSRPAAVAVDVPPAGAATGSDPAPAGGILSTIKGPS